MEMTDSLARLMRAGGDNSRWLEKLREAVDSIAKDFFAKHLPSGGFANNLPRNYCFRHWASGQYELKKCDGRGHDVFVLTRENKWRGSVIAFADDMADGWVEEVSKYFEDEADKFKTASTAISRFLEKH